MTNRKPKSALPDFGEPVDLDLLLGFAEIDVTDTPSALAWWDENASEEWVGALDNKPIGRRK